MTTYDDRHAAYITGLFTAHDAVLQRIREDLPRRGLPAISIKPEEGRFLQFLVRACGARRAVEIGTLGGYSGIWIARALPPGGRLITLEREPRHAAVAREHFALAGVADRVEIRLGEARALLAQLAAEGPFDFCFVDAEKADYDAYLDWALAGLRPGGVVAVHNAFQVGAVVDPDRHEAQTEIVRAFNRRFAAEPRLLGTIYPAGDGMLVGVVLG
jgi:caffeoyl-CoA O-methyltransferase